MDRGALQTAVHGVAKSQTRLSDEAHSTCMAPMQGIQTYNAPSWSASLLVVYICIKKENCSLSMC